ncbi:hypothetical protein SLS59_001120 [Nothophoma quercina]|uniref:Uncharacterized protein n=1 Tax=Nothophoma quercina TaxID=749835 RepID=A0ABR3RZE3_9PLEO
MDMHMGIRTVCRAPTNYYYDKPLPPVPYGDAYDIETELADSTASNTRSLRSRGTTIADLRTLRVFSKHVENAISEVIAAQHIVVDLFYVDAVELGTDITVLSEALA